MLFSVLQVSERLGVSEITVRRLIKLRRISYRKIGDRYLFSEADISSYLDSISVPAIPRQGEAFHA